LLSLAGEEVVKQFARLLQLSCVCLVANFKDRVRRKLSIFRCGLGGSVEEIKQRVTYRPDLGQHQFGGISGPLSRSAQSGPAQPLGESLSRAFGGSFDLGQFVRSQPRGRSLGAEAGLRLVAERQTGLWSGLNAGNAHLRNRFVPGAEIISVAFATKSLCYRKFLCSNTFT